MIFPVTGFAKPYGVTNPTGALSLSASPLKSIATAPKTLTLSYGTAPGGILKPVVGASATLGAEPVKATASSAPLQPKITPSKSLQPAAPSAPEGADKRALPRPDSVPALSWKTVGVFAAAGLVGYLLFGG